MTGKIVISIVNPLNQTYDGLVTESTTSAAEELAKVLPYSKIVKAFNTVFAADFYTPSVGGKTVDVSSPACSTSWSGDSARETSNR